MAVRDEDTPCISLSASSQPVLSSVSHGSVSTATSTVVGLNFPSIDILINQAGTSSGVHARSNLSGVPKVGSQLVFQPLLGTPIAAKTVPSQALSSESCPTVSRISLDQQASTASTPKTMCVLDLPSNPSQSPQTLHPTPKPATQTMVPASSHVTTKVKASKAVITTKPADKIPSDLPTSKAPETGESITELGAAPVAASSNSATIAALLGPGIIDPCPTMSHGKKLPEKGFSASQIFENAKTLECSQSAIRAVYAKTHSVDFEREQKQQQMIWRQQEIRDGYQTFQQTVRVGHQEINLRNQQQGEQGNPGIAAQPVSSTLKR